MVGAQGLDDPRKKDVPTGSLIIFGAVTGGSIGLMLVNASWKYRSTNNTEDEESPQTSRWYGCLPHCCPTAQTVGTSIILFVSAVLLPTYREDTILVILIVFGVALPLLVMVNLPLLFNHHVKEEIVEDNLPV